jgi:hypothetical protein
MTTLLMGAGTTGDADSHSASVRDDEHGVVSVHSLGFGNTTAWCSCGWAGRRRLLKAVAMQDAWAHAAQDSCEVSSPLLLAW